MDYQVMKYWYNYSPADADILFATNDKREGIEAAKEFDKILDLKNKTKI